MSAERLPDAELEILACLWLRGESTAREVREAIAEYRPLAHASVMTLLGRLEERGLIARRKGDIGRAFLYRATKKPDPTYRRLLQNVLHRVFGGNGVAMVTSLFEAQPPTTEQISELEKLLQDLKRRENKRRRR